MSGRSWSARGRAAPRPWRAVSSEELWPALLALLLGRASVLGGLSPFALAYLAAQRDRLGERSVLLAGLALVGCALQGRGAGYVAAQAAQYLLFFLGYAWFGGPRREPARVAVLAGVVPLVWGALPLVLWGAVPYTLFRVLLGALATFFSALLFLRVFAGGRARTVEELPALILVAVLGLLGVAGIRWGPFGLQGTAGDLLTLAVAWAAGAAPGAAAGALAGVLGATGNGAAALQGTALGGLLAGLLRDQGRSAAAAAYLLGSLFVGAALARGAFEPTMADALAAAVLFGLIPAATWERLRRAVPDPAAQAAAAARQELARRLRDLGGVFRELSRSFEQTALGRRTVGGGEGSPLLQVVADRFCAGCSMWKSCWDDSFYATCRRLEGLLRGVEAGRAGAELERSLRGVCRRRQELVTVAGCLQELARRHAAQRLRRGEWQDLVSKQLQGVADLVEGIAVEEAAAGPEGTARRGEEIFEATAAAARRSKEEGAPCGDSYLLRRLPGRHYLVALSDGMGVGPRAARQSRSALALLEQLLVAGFTAQVAARTVNSVLLLRSAAEDFATLDLGIVDLADGRLELMKIGAAPSYLWHAGQVGVLRGAAPPVGILGELAPARLGGVLTPGDVLVMVTDGVSEAAGGEEWLSGFLAAAGEDPPQRLAEAVLAAAVAKGSGGPGDDMTVVAVRLERQEAAPVTVWRCLTAGRRG
ncbi:MAG: SpoIIE family protein phosphatase [Thermaerobacter sp.]|nr:SpoIIE family protein phosphatase [Thermaerobacter sp.]